MSRAYGPRPEALGADPRRVVAGIDEQVRDRLDEARRAADEDVRCGVGRRAELGQHRGADAAAEVARARRGRARVGPAHVEVRGGLQRPQLVGVQRQRRLPDRDQRAGVDLARVARAMAQHRHQRHEPRPAADEQQRAAVGDRPRERAADRPAHLELVADLHDLGQVGRDLAVVDPVDRDRRSRVLGRARERERALRLVAVGRGQADVEMLAGAVAVPVGDLEHERLRAAATPRSSRGPAPPSTSSGARRINRPGIAARARGRRSRGSR